MFCRPNRAQFLHILLFFFQVTDIICHLKDLGEITRNITGVIEILRENSAKLNYFSFNVQFFNKDVICSGSIMSTKTVLTAAHCFDHNKNLGEMTVLSTYKYLSDYESQQHKVWDFRIHPHYNTTTIYSNDVAILLIQDAFLFGPDDQPARVVDNLEWMRERETFMTSGAGATSDSGGESQVLTKQTKLRYISHEKCMKSHKGVVFSPDMFCLYGDGVSDPCTRNSGGGILWKNMIVGIMSRGESCLTRPGIYVNVYYHAAWIKNTTEQLHIKYCKFHSYG